MFGDPTAHLFGSPETSPEHRLSVAVLHRAVLDLFTLAKASDSSITLVEQRNNLSFLTDTGGGWAEMRREHCAVAGIDENAVRKTVLRWLHDEDDGHLLGSIHGRAGARPVAISEATTRKLFFEMQAGGVAGATQSRIVAARAQTKKSPKRAMPAMSSEVTRLNKEKIVNVLRGKPCRVRELNFAFDGDLSCTRIRELLRLLEADGVIHRDDAYVWHLSGEDMSDAA